MTFTLDTTHSNALLIGASEFPKDAELAPMPLVHELFCKLYELITDPSMFKIPKEQVNTILNPQDNTTLKEQIVSTAEKTFGVFFCFIATHFVNRKGQYYIATNHSSKQQIHVNGIALAELFEMVRESPAVLKIFVIDAHYTKLSSDAFSESDVEVLRSVIEDAEKDVSGLVVILSNPINQPQELRQTLLQSFLGVMEQGIKVEEEFLSINQIYDAILDRTGKQNLALPLRNKKTLVSDKKITYNRNYITFKKLVEEAESLFQKEDYEAALEKYQEASRLFHGNPLVKDKIEFIKLYQEAEHLYEAQAYEQSFKLYEDALRFFHSETINKKLWSSKERLADIYYGQENFEAARQLYEELLHHQPDNAVFSVRFRKCNDEIQFFDLVDEADKYYFEDNFEKAYETYKKALQIKYDHKTQRRKLECERFLEREKILREKIADAIKREIEEKYKAELAEKHQTASLQKHKQEDIEQISARIAEELNAKYEETLWTRISIRNDIESYKLYLDIFPQGIHSQKAKQRISELEQIKSSSSQQNTPNEPSNVRIHVDPAIINQPSTSISKHAPAMQRIKLSEQRKVTESAGEGVEQLPELPENMLSSDATLSNVNVAEKSASGTSIADSLLQTAAEIESNSATPSEPIKYLFSVEDIIPKKQPPKSTESPKVIPEGFKQNMTEEELWQTAVRIGTVEAYTYYVDTTKEASHVVDAYYMINKLNKENKTSTETSAADSVLQEISSFTSHHTLKPETQENREKVRQDTSNEKLEGYTAADYAYEDKLWKEATTENTLSSYYNYINNTVIKRFWQEAKERIRELKEEAKNNEEKDWKAAKQADTIEAYRAYVRKYPLGNYYAQAMFRINELS
ncbi:MAG: hypothetical protein NZM38_07045 [Cytophagales bacterium]|nr:hypothetical protein [Cytophagales bacterium]MDW8384512.1 hypothetical protein [Flammeovirgaceae bacterium]